MSGQTFSTSVFGWLLIWVCPYDTFAQDWQNRDVLHLEYEINNKFSLRTWSITNFRSKTPNNTNLLAGIGYRGNSWWVESLVQHQWSSKGNHWMLDFRFDRQLPKWHLYAEAALFLTKKASYEFVIIERKLGKRVAVGGETENTHQAGRDIVQIGPRVGSKLGSFLGFNVSVAGTVRISPLGGYAEPRIYLIFNRRIGK